MDPEILTSLLDGSLIKSVTSLGLFSAGVDAFQALSNCKQLDNLRKLNLATNNMGVQSVKNLKKCLIKNLTELNLSHVKKFGAREAKELLTSSFMSPVMSLDLSCDEYTVGYFNLISGSKYLVQLTSLKLNQSSQSGSDDYGLALFLKDKVNLEYLSITNHRTSIYPDLFTGGQFQNLTHLDVSHNNMSNSSLVDIIISPNLPKLTTLVAKSFNWGNTDKQHHSVVQIPENSQSSLTKLDLSGTYVLPLAYVTYYCPKLKVLKVSYSSSRYIPDQEELKKAYTTMISAPTLSNLEYLKISDISCLESLFEIVFTSPFFSNLQKLTSTCCNVSGINLGAGIVAGCTNLTSLRIIKAYGVTASGDCKKALKTNPTFSKLRKIRLGISGEYYE